MLSDLSDEPLFVNPYISVFSKKGIYKLATLETKRINKTNM